MFRTGNVINEGSCSIIEIVEAEYVNIFVYGPLSGSTYIKFPCMFKNSKKGLVNIKNNDNKCLLWCHIRYLNPLRINP